MKKIGDELNSIWDGERIRQQKKINGTGKSSTGHSRHRYTEKNVHITELVPNVHIYLYIIIYNEPSM